MDPRLLAAAYDRSAQGYDARFRDLQRVKFRAAAKLVEPPPPGSLCLDAGGGTGLLLEWIAEEQPAWQEARWVLLDLSLGMLKQGRTRSPLLLAADLARPPLLPRFSLVCAFTSVLTDAQRALAALGALLLPDGQLAVSFLSDEAPSGNALARAAGLSLQTGGVPAGQDRLFVLRKKERS